MPLKTFLAMNFLRCVMVACAEHRMKLRFRVRRDVDMHSKHTLTWNFKNIACLKEILNLLCKVSGILLLLPTTFMRKFVKGRIQKFKSHLIKLG